MRIASVMTRLVGPALWNLPSKNLPPFWMRASASDVTFLISATAVDKRRSFYKTLGKRAELQVIDRLDSKRDGWEEEVTEVVLSHGKKRKLRFDDDALDLFVPADRWRYAPDRERAGKD